MTITIYIDVMYVEIPATREKCRNLQEIVQEFAGISGICRNIRNLQEFAGIAGPWHPCTHPRVGLKALGPSRSLIVRLTSSSYYGRLTLRSSPALLWSSRDLSSHLLRSGVGVHTLSSAYAL